MLLKIGITAEMLLHENVTGIERYICDLSQKLVIDKRHDIKLILPSAVYEKQYPEMLKFKYDPPLIQLSTFFRSRFFSSFFNYPRRLREFDIIHSPTVTAPFFFRPPGVKVVMTVHDLIPNLFPKWQPLKRKIYFQYFLNHRLRYVDRFITDSENTKKDLMSLFKIDSDKIDVVYLGASKRFKTNKETKRQDFILGVSTIEPRKNFKRLIDAYIMLKEKHNIVEKLYIVGKEGWFFNNIINIPEKFKNDIVFKGYVSNDQLIALYQSAKVFVYPSLYEGFGLPVLEAMACGCPVITSNVSSLPEVGGDAVLYVNPEDKVQLSQKIYEVILDDVLQEKMSQDGIKQAARFTWEKCAENTIKVYEKVMNH
ncbi:MAG: glycosyltransferase family 1 protein [Pseudomonadota bacterium]